jgi:hypothetical protein
MVFEQELAETLVDLIRQHVAAVTRPLHDRIEALEKQAAEFKYVGVWRGGASYRKHNFCTHDGSVWICLSDTEGKPGQSLQWQLAVRKGRDGKDAKAAA